MHQSQREVNAILSKDGIIQFLVGSQVIDLQDNITTNDVSLESLEIDTEDKTTTEVFTELASKNLQYPNVVTGPWACNDLPTGVLSANIQIYVESVNPFTLLARLYSADVSPHEWTCTYCNNEVEWIPCSYSEIQKLAEYNKLNKVSTYNANPFTFERYSLAADTRWFYSCIIPKDQLIESIKLNVASYVTYIIELWKKVGDQLTLDKSVTFAAGSSGNVTQLINIGYHTTTETMISVKSNTASKIGAYRQSDASCYATASITESTLAVSGLNMYSGYAIGGEVTVSKSGLVDFINHSSSETVLTVGVGRQYANIQQALDEANDSVDNHVTILVYPGTYPSFSMVGYPNSADAVPGANVLRYVSIIGTDRDYTIVKDTQGDYRHPPAEVRTVGTIKNMTFIASHEEAPATLEASETNRASYAVHCDFYSSGVGIQHTKFENCIMISYHGAALGLGLHQDEIVELVNCELYNYGDGTFGGTSYSNGALYCHARNAENVTNQKLKMRACYCYASHAWRGARISMLGEGSTGEIESIGSTFYTASEEATTYNVYMQTIEGNPGFSIAPTSHGNNVSILNAES